MTNCNSGAAKIIPGSKAQFTLYLVDDEGRPVSLTPYSAGNLVFLSKTGTRTVIALLVPGANPDKGEIPVVLTAANTATADQGWLNADIELTQGVDTLIIPIADKFEIVKRFAPPIV